MTPLYLLAVLGCGALFGYGLALSTMIRPEVVLSFLRGQDFGLMLVMGGAVAGLFVIGVLVVARIIEALGDDDYHQ